MKRRALIIGASGLLAPALGRRLQEEGWLVRHTSRRGDVGLRLDLAELQGTVPPGDFDAVFFIAAETSLRRCEDDPAATHVVNVRSPAAMANYFAARGSHVLTLSTNLVFDGTTAAAPAALQRQPACVYGKQKAELEDIFLALGARATVLRITKIVESLDKLTAGWADDLAAGRPIHPFSDLVCAPVSLARVLDILVHAAARRVAGMFQHSGDRDIGYAEIARVICRRMKLPEALVAPVRGADLLVPPVALPRHTTLAETLPAGFAPEEPENASAVLAGFLDRRGTA